MKQGTRRTGTKLRYLARTHGRIGRDAFIALFHDAPDGFVVASQEHASGVGDYTESSNWQNARGGYWSDGTSGSFDVVFDRSDDDEDPEAVAFDRRNGLAP